MLGDYCIFIIISKAKIYCGCVDDERTKPDVVYKVVLGIEYGHVKEAGKFSPLQKPHLCRGSVWKVSLHHNWSAQHGELLMVWVDLFELPRYYK